MLYDPYALYLNVEGVRPTANNPSLADPPNILWLLGGSTMRGATDDDARTIPSYLAAILNRDKPDSYLVNFGENSFNSLLETKYLQKLLIERKPSPTRIIFYDGANDCTYFVQYRTPGAHLGYRRVRALIESYHQSLLGLFKPLNAAWNASFSRELAEKFRGVAGPLKADSPLVQEFVDACERRYDHVNKIAACYGAEFLLFWQPLWWVETVSDFPGSAGAGKCQFYPAEPALCRLPGQYYRDQSSPGGTGCRTNPISSTSAISWRPAPNPYIRLTGSICWMRAGRWWPSRWLRSWKNAGAGLDLAPESASSLK